MGEPSVGAGSPAKPIRRRWLSALALLASLHLLLLYGLPGGVTLGLLVLLGVFYFRAGATAAVATTLSLGLATLVYAYAVHLLGLDERMYYRPHERLAEQEWDYGHRAYRKNESIEMRMPHGDLRVFGDQAPAQPREVVFRTDAEGFRNDRPYADGDWVLIGDSFVVGMGDSQADILSAQLARDHGLKVYNLGQPGDVSDYLLYWQAFRARHPGAAKGVLFLFEGNDFPEAADYESAAAERPGTLERWAGRYYALFSSTAMHRVTKSMYKRATRTQDAASGSVQVREVGGQRMGLYAPYVEVSKRPSYTLPPAMQRDLETLMEGVERVFFIPTKYRVYAGILGDPSPPHAQWDALAALCGKHGWRCSDLTPALIEASARLLPAGEFTWWLDDTHWNREGMAAAARVVAEGLQAGRDAGATGKTS